VKRGPIATIEIGIEVKTIHKAMIKQIDRVITDMKNQVNEFKAHHGKPITISVVGINCATTTVS
jgi:signal recognition particle GTPase